MTLCFIIFDYILMKRLISLRKLKISSGLEFLKRFSQDRNTISDTPSIDKQNQSNRNVPRTSENRNNTQRKTHNQTTQANTPD